MGLAQKMTVDNKVEIAPEGTNITGMYRKCQKLDGTCDTLVSCPYTHCKEHWIAKAMPDSSGVKEVKP